MCFLDPRATSARHKRSALYHGPVRIYDGLLLREGDVGDDDPIEAKLPFLQVSLFQISRPHPANSTTVLCLISTLPFRDRQNLPKASLMASRAGNPDKENGRFDVMTFFHLSVTNVVIFLYCNIFTLKSHCIITQYRHKVIIS